MGSDDSGTRTLLVDASGLGADLRTVDVLAQLQLTARRGGYRLLLSGTSAELRELIAFAGLEEALPEEPLRLEPRR
jgi:hypothetical protein